MSSKKKTLFVSDGVVRPDPINPDAVHKFRQQKKKILKPEQYADGIRAHDRTILSQAITLIESSLPSHRDLAAQIIDKCIPLSGNSLRIGITGVPGVGKSTFIESLGKMVTVMGRKLAVLAVDPSSNRSGGSIMGDKTRMETLSQDPEAFIRPSPSGGTLGGVARKTRETIILCEAAGFDTIFVETTGVGQSETAVHSMVDFFLLLMLAGAGDELQGIKRGIMEMADAVVITKADGANMHRAEIAKTEFTNALHFYPPSESGWIPKVMTCSAKNVQGLEEIWETIISFEELSRKSGYFQNNRNQQAIARMYDSINESLKSDFYNSHGIAEKIEEYKRNILKNKISSYQAAQEILECYFKRFKKNRDI
jgi:LAO/AO transport system kinase